MSKVLRFFAFLCLCVSVVPCSAADKYLSHPPLRVIPPPGQRPLDKGPALFVDAARGSDNNDGSEKSPWQTVNHALKQLKPGDTLYLRGGTYFENVYCAVAGKKDAPITLRSYPGEQAVLDGGLREFQETPGQAWEPAPLSPSPWSAAPFGPKIH